jgi:hypothetical protein
VKLRPWEIASVQEIQTSAEAASDLGATLANNPAAGSSGSNAFIGSLPIGNLLAILATALLVFVSVGVAYLSTVEWRDRRRRGKPTTRS